MRKHLTELSAEFCSVLLLVSVSDAQTVLCASPMHKCIMHVDRTSICISHECGRVQTSVCFSLGGGGRVSGELHHEVNDVTAMVDSWDWEKPRSWDSAPNLIVRSPTSLTCSDTCAQSPVEILISAQHWLGCVWKGID